MRRIVAQTRKELTQIVRDWRTLLLALILPLILLMLLGNAISLSVTDIPMVVQDLDNSPASRELIDAFRSSLTLRVVPWPANKQPVDALTTNTARAALIIPTHFERNLKRSADAPVQIIVDASDANTARLVAGYSGQIIAAHNRATAPSPSCRRVPVRPARSLRPRRGASEMPLQSWCTSRSFASNRPMFTSFPTKLRYWRRGGTQPRHAVPARCR